MASMDGKVAVVANAGVVAGAPLGSITEKQFDFITGVYLKGVLFTMQAALPHLKPGGTAVIIGSTASIHAQQGMSIYGATKAGLRMFVRTWIQGLKGSGIRINMLSPGAVDTPSLRKAFADASSPETVEVNVKRMGEGTPPRAGSVTLVRSAKPQSSCPATSPASSRGWNCSPTEASLSLAEIRCSSQRR